MIKVFSSLSSSSSSSSRLPASLKDRLRMSTQFVRTQPEATTNDQKCVNNDDPREEREDDMHELIQRLQFEIQQRMTCQELLDEIKDQLKLEQINARKLKDQILEFTTLKEKETDEEEVHVVFKHEHSETKSPLLEKKIDRLEKKREKLQAQNRTLEIERTVLLEQQNLMKVKEGEWFKKEQDDQDSSRKDQQINQLKQQLVALQEQVLKLEMRHTKIEQEADRVQTKFQEGRILIEHHQQKRLLAKKEVHNLAEELDRAHKERFELLQLSNEKTCHQIAAIASMRDQIQLLMVHYFGKIRDGSVKIESNVTNDIKPNLDQVSTAIDQLQLKVNEIELLIETQDQPRHLTIRSRLWATLTSCFHSSLPYSQVQEV